MRLRKSNTMAQRRQAGDPRAVLLLLCLALLAPALVVTRLTPSDAGNSGVSDSEVEKSGHKVPSAPEIAVLEAPQERNDAAEAQLEDCFALLDDSSEPCGFEQRMLRDYGPPGRADNPHPGGPIGP